MFVQYSMNQIGICQTIFPPNRTTPQRTLSLPSAAPPVSTQHPLPGLAPSRTSLLLFSSFASPFAFPQSRPRRSLSCAASAEPPAHPSLRATGAPVPQSHGRSRPTARCPARRQQRGLCSGSTRDFNFVQRCVSPRANRRAVRRAMDAAAG